MTAFAAVRVAKIRDLNHLSQIQSHGRRLDPSSERRVDKSRTSDNIALSPYADDPLDLITAFKERKRRAQASEHGNAKSIGVHALLVVSPSVIAQAGDVHDPGNPMNRRLVKEGISWAEKEFGAGSVTSVRLDVDEAGSGVLDLVIVPVQERRVNATRTKKLISVSGALEAIHERWRDRGARTSFGALQDSWSEHARATIDPTIRRGNPKKETGRDHVHADVYRAAAEAAKEEIERLKIDLEQQLATADERIRQQAKVGLERGYERGLEMAEARIQQAEAQATEKIEASLERVKEAVSDGEIIDAGAEDEIGVEWEKADTVLGTIRPVFAETLSEARRQKITNEIAPIWPLVSTAVATAFDWARRAGTEISAAADRLGW